MRYFIVHCSISHQIEILNVYKESMGGGDGDGGYKQTNTPKVHSPQKPVKYRKVSVCVCVGEDWLNKF